MHTQFTQHIPEALACHSGPPEAKQSPHRRGEDRVESDEGGHDDVRQADQLDRSRGRLGHALCPAVSTQALLYMLLLWLSRVVVLFVVQ